MPTPTVLAEYTVPVTRTPPPPFPPGYRLRPPGSPVTETQKRMILTLYYLSGVSRHSIAAIVGTSYSTVCRYIRRERIVCEPPTPITATDTTTGFTHRTVIRRVPREQPDHKPSTPADETPA